MVLCVGWTQPPTLPERRSYLEPGHARDFVYGNPDGV
jgi:hypothetical protein